MNSEFHTALLFFAGIVVGFLFGVIIAGLLAASRVEDEWRERLVMYAMTGKDTR